MTQDDNAKGAVLHRGPRGLGLFGSLGDFSRDQLGFYVRCARESGTSCRCVWALEPSDSHWSIYRDLLRMREEEEDGGPQCA